MKPRSAGSDWPIKDSCGPAPTTPEQTSILLPVRTFVAFVEACSQPFMQKCPQLLRRGQVNGSEGSFGRDSGASNFQQEPKHTRVRRGLT